MIILINTNLIGARFLEHKAKMRPNLRVSTMLVNSYIDKTFQSIFTLNFSNLESWNGFCIKDKTTKLKQV